MRRSLHEVNSFPCECPNCHAAAGFPYRAATDPNRPDCVHLDIRCRDCKREWQVERSTKPFGLTSLEAAHVI